MNLVWEPRRKSPIISAFLMILWFMFSQKMLGRALPDPKKPEVALEEVFKIKTSMIREELFKTSFTVYYLKKNETLYRLSRRYFTSLSALMSLNRITDPRSIPEGRKLYIPPVDYNSGRLQTYLVKNGDTLASILNRSGLELWQFRRINAGWDKDSLRPGIVLKLPFREINRFQRRTTISLLKPVAGRLTSRFGFRWGRMHYGIDLAAPRGTAVRAVASGIVKFAGWKGSYGFLVKLSHGKYNTYYGHLSKILVRRGSYIHKGSLIGLVGATGRAYGNHLHFELEVGGVKVDPIHYIRQFPVEI